MHVEIKNQMSQNLHRLFPPTVGDLPTDIVLVEVGKIMKYPYRQPMESMKFVWDCILHDSIVLYGLLVFYFVLPNDFFSSSSKSLICLRRSDSI